MHICAHVCAHVRPDVDVSIFSSSSLLYCLSLLLSPALHQHVPGSFCFYLSNCKVMWACTTRPKIFNVDSWGLDPGHVILVQQSYQWSHLPTPTVIFIIGFTFKNPICHSSCALPYIQPFCISYYRWCLLIPRKFTCSWMLRKYQCLLMVLLGDWLLGHVSLRPHQIPYGFCYFQL